MSFLDKHTLVSRYEARNRNQKSPIDRFYSVEFFLNESKLLYQFKVWNGEANVMFALAKEGSIIMNELNVGDIFNMKYYSSDPSCPTTNMTTKISSIEKDNNGRFKGHYVIGLSIAGENCMAAVQ